MELSMVGLRHPMVDDYLRQLELAARVLPDRVRDVLVGDTRAQLDLLLGADPPEAQVRMALDAMGDPARIVEPLLPPGWAPGRPRARERLALLLLLGLVPLTWTTYGLAAILWLAGVALLAWSPLWSKGQKLVGALAWPGLIGLPFTLARLLLGSAGPSIKVPVVFLAVMAPAALLALWLYRAAGRQVPTTEPIRRR
jgi:hypothetical protein